jgi:hypothetical protein
VRTGCTGPVIASAIIQALIILREALVLKKA